MFCYRYDIFALEIEVKGGFKKGPGGDFLSGPFSIWQLRALNLYFFLVAMISFRALAGRALTTFLAGILMTAPV